MRSSLVIEGGLKEFLIAGFHLATAVDNAFILVSIRISRSCNADLSICRASIISFLLNKQKWGALFSYILKKDL